MQEGYEASSQIMNAFKHMMPLLQRIPDPDLKLAENPALPKRQRNSGGGKGQGKTVKTEEDEHPGDNLATAFKLLARMVIRQDQEMQNLRRETNFVFFFSGKATTGALPLLLQSAAKWHDKTQTEQAKYPWVPLRQHLLQALLNDLMTRVEQLGKADASSELMRTAVQQKVLLEDHSCPYMEWNQHSKQLQVSRRIPQSIQAIYKTLEALVEQTTNSEMIRSFHALPASPQSSVVAWKLQVGVRYDAAHQLLCSLSQSSIWTLIGASFKQHTQYQSNMASQLEQLMNLQPKKGAGKHRSKGK